MLIIGLTGGIGTGKSKVSSILRGQRFPVIDADQVSREVLFPGTLGWFQVRKAFGDEILNFDRTINRRKLGKIIFEDSAQRAKLNGILHPKIRWLMFSKILKHFCSFEPIIILDIPLLFETKVWTHLCDEIMVVYCEPSVQLHRLKQRDNDLTQDELISRINAQMPLEEKIARATLLIDNNGTVDECEASVNATMDLLVHSPHTTYRIWRNKIAVLLILGGAAYLVFFLTKKLVSSMYESLRS